jgi:trk system potassium uptake protein
MTVSNGARRSRRYAAMQRVIGILLMLFSLTNLPPLLVNWIYGEDVVRPFLMGLWITLASGAALWWPVRHDRSDLKMRDGFLITVLFYTVLSIFGAIPLVVTGSGWPSLTEAIFETVSGITTTGATVVSSGLDQLPHSINYYRAQLQFLGGMGIIVLAVAVLPMLGIGGMQLYRTETPGPMKDNKLTPRIAGTARALWIVYLLLTVMCGLAYWLCGMNAFDAVIHAFTTVATGGFSNHDASIGYFNNPTLEYVVMLFMLLGTINFAVHFTAFRERNPLLYLRDSEVLTCIAIIGGFTFFIFLPLLAAEVFPDAATALRKTLFHVISYGTTTGYATADPSGWPIYTPLMLMLCAFMVGCAGSTSGGVKVVRLMLFVKQAMRELYHLVHPSAEAPIKLQGRVVPDPVVYAVGGFFSVYIGFTILLTFVMMTTGLDAVTAFSAVSASLNNLGPGLGALSTSMDSVSTAGKWVMIFAMLLGRLEIFTLLIIFTPTFWRR